MSLTQIPRRAGDSRAIEMLIATRVLSPGARGMAVAQIAHQHNESNAIGAGHALFMDPDQPLLDQVDRIAHAALFEN